ncbi:MAG TPA: LarC family nickel insertion protein, partial [Bacillota bacterium]|nr:LarC family nickel insertion protein [Bacillota bacterium]
MKVLYFDCFSGISGDMTLAALLDLGVEEGLLRAELDKLKLDGYELVVGKSIKNGITGMDVQVILTPGEGHHQHHGRNLRDIEVLIDESDISQRVKDFSKKVFREIAAAEAKVHDKDIFEVHFHEVGAVDSIVDIVGTGICLDLLGVDRVFASKLYDGHGFIQCQHGTIPVPVPAVLQMLAGSGIPLVQTE